MIRVTRACWVAIATAFLVSGGGRAYADDRDDAYHENHCERPLVICYDRDGKLFSGTTTQDQLPEALQVGDKVTVVVLTQKAADLVLMVGDHTLVTVVFAARPSLEHLFSSVIAHREEMNTEIPPNGAPDKPAPYTPLSFFSDPVPDDSVDLTISFQRRAQDGDPGVDTTEHVPVNLGYSYFSVALLVAATYKADRHVLRDLDTTSDHAVGPGLALNIFPGGRQRGVIGYLRRCGLGSWAHARRCLANNVGFQIATDLDLTDPTDKLYLGLVFEPVAGLALVGGVSLRKVDVVPPAGALPAVEAMGNSPSETRYVTRGYVGVTITLDLLDTISSVGGSIKKIKAP